MASFGVSVFTSKDPSQKKAGIDPIWSGVQFSWTPGIYKKPISVGHVGDMLKTINKATLSAAAQKNTYWLIYGNGSDFLGNKDESGWDWFATQKPPKK